MAAAVHVFLFIVVFVSTIMFTVVAAATMSTIWLQFNVQVLKRCQCALLAGRWKECGQHFEMRLQWPRAKPMAQRGIDKSGKTTEMQAVLDEVGQATIEKVFASL
jgi:hypothetical protein